MATQKTDFDGTVWFLTRFESGKVSEIQQDSHVTLIYADPKNENYVAAEGKATLSNDRGKKDPRTVESDVQGMVPGGRG